MYTINNIQDTTKAVKVYEMVKGAPYVIDTMGRGNSELYDGAIAIATYNNIITFTTDNTIVVHTEQDIDIFRFRPLNSVTVTISQ